MTTRFPHLRAAIVQQPWAIMPERLEAIAEVVERRVEGIRLSPEEIAGIKGERRPNGVATMFNARTFQPIDAASAAQGNAPAASVIAVISFFGIVAQHASQVDDISGPGGTSTERVASSFRAAMSDPSVKAIIINFDSPGGNVYGVQVLADEIFNARGQKPVVAQVNSLAASAAYWVACSCDEIVVTPGGQVGSIGVYALHQDVSQAADAAGVKFTFISAGKYKVEGNQFQPLGDEATQALQSQIDGYYSDFVSAVARGRGVATDDVTGGFGQGRVEKDKKAVKAGMADRVDTLDGTIKRLASAKRSGGSKAETVGFQETPLDAAALVINQQTADSGERTYQVVGNFPNVTVVSSFMVEELLSDNTIAVVDEVLGTLAFTFQNGTATYELTGLTASGDWICKLAASHVDAPDLAAEDSDAFRRRRHAHRLRGA